MEQLKKIGTFLKQHFFWLTCGLLVLVAVGIALSSARSMKATRLANEQALDSAIGTIERVLNTTAATGDLAVKAHPNPSTMEGMQQQVQAAATVAVEAWKIRRDVQSPFFSWPSVLGEQVNVFKNQPIPEKIPLPAAFRGSAAAPGSPATAADESAAAEMNTQVLQKYGNEIQKVMPEIAKIIGANWKYDPNKKEPAAGQNPAGQAQDNVGVGAAGGIAGRGNAAQAGTDEEGVKIEKFVVDWRQADQQRWYDLVTVFDPRNVSGRPNMVQAIYLQEDLWLLEAMFRIVKDVNGDADANDIASIKKIDHIFFGRDAQGLSGQISAPDRRLQLMAREKKRNDLAPPRASAASRAAGGQVTLKSRFTDPADGRFVDSQFLPIKADEVRAAVNSDVLGDNAELTVAKRIPFRVAFVMDERKIPDFLAACANSPFRFETRQMRINRHNPGEAGSLDPRQRNTNPGQSDTVTTGLPGRGQSAPDAAAGPMTSTRTNYDVKVEFYGIVKLYNPVNYRLFELQPPETTSETAALER